MWNLIKCFYGKEGYIHYMKTNKLILWLDNVNIFYETLIQLIRIYFEYHCDEVCK